MPTVEQLTRLADLRRLDYLLKYKWTCNSEIPNCTGAPHPGHPHPHGRPEQLPPPGDWWGVLWCTGRSFGKTRSAAEWIKSRMMKEKNHRVALIAPDFAAGRDIMVEGESGLRGLEDGQGVIPWEYIRTWNRSIGEITLVNGSQARIFGTSTTVDAEALRGYQVHSAWIDELATCRYGALAWDQLSFCLRLGNDPRVVITTTPKPIPIIKKLLTDSDIVVIRGSLYDNIANLPPSAVARLKETMKVRDWERRSYSAKC